MKKFLITIVLSLLSCICVYAAEEDVAAVEELIDAISDEASCEEAREAYDALSMSDKLSVSNLQDLIDAEEEGFDDTETEEENDTAEDSEETFETVEGTAEEDEEITEGKASAVTGDAMSIYWYVFEYTGEEQIFVLEFEESTYSFTIYSPSGNTYPFSSSTDTYNDLDIDMTWNTPYVTIILGNIEEGQWYINTDGLCSISQQRSIAAIEETEEAAEEEGGSPIGLIVLVLIIALFVFVYFFFFKKKTTLKRKELPKRTPEEEVEMIRRELYKMDFRDYGMQPDLSFMNERRQERHIDISIEDSYEELEDGTRDLHSSALQEEVKRYMKEQKEQGGQ